MADRVRIQTRRSALAEKLQREVRETVVLRNQEVVAVLPEGDPMAYVLDLSAGELLELREKLRPILESRPELRSLLEALIEYRRPARTGGRRENHGRGQNGG
jgi:PHD/YefM family antitoxin component YafN of YafNO toxin-antitoxin module